MDDEIARLERLHAETHSMTERIGAYRAALIANDIHPIIADRMCEQYHTVLMAEFDRALIAQREAQREQLAAQREAVMKILDRLGVQAA